MRARWGGVCASTTLGLFILALITAGAMYAQESTGSILGTVTDESGGAVPDAKVTISGPALPRGLDTQTDSSGQYQFARVPIGTYAVSVTKTGFNTFRQQAVEVMLGSQVTVNARLAVGQVTQVVEVTEASISIDPTSSRTSTNISQQQFENVAHGRTFNSVLQMAPGVRSEIKGGNAGVGGFQVDGSSGSENAYIIDGVEVSDVRRGSLRSSSAIPLEFVQEVQVKSGGFEAEYGGATGGVVNVATRSGSNGYHGLAFFDWTNSGLNASDRGYYQRSAANAAVAEFRKPKEDDYHVYYPGGSIGGPILKDRLFFFGSLSPELEHTDRTINYASGAQTFKQDMKRWYGMGRLDANPFQKLQVNATYIWSPMKINGYLPSRDPRLAPPSNDQSILGGYLPAQTVTTSATYTATPHLVLSGRWGWRYMNDKVGLTSGNYAVPTQPYIVYADSSVGMDGVPADLQQPNGFKNVSSTFAILKDITTRQNLNLDGTYIWRSHTFKAGYQLNRLHNDVLNDYTNGMFNIYWGESFTRGNVSGATGKYGYYIWEDGVKNSGSVYSRNQGFFFQDNWRVTRRLTINAGIRFENEFLPPFKAEVEGKTVNNPISFDWGSKIAPRIGAALDVLGDGRWKLSGSFGIFYDVMKYELARGSFGSDYWWSHVYTLDNPAAIPSLGFANPGAAGSVITAYDNRTLPIDNQGNIQGVDLGIKPYKSREFTINLEHSLATRLVAGVRYTRKDLLRAIEDIGVLDADGNEVYLIGNPGFGRTRNDTGDATTPPHTYDMKTPDGKEYLVPNAVRQYDAVEFRLQGQARNAFFLGSYTWSRLWGNYSGAANSDESGRSDPGVSRAFDLPYYYFDASGSQRNVFGVLGTDRPHTFKFFGSYDLHLGRAGTTNFGLSQIAYSGTPDTSTIIYLSAPTSPYGRGDLGRTPFLTQTDIQVYHEFSMTERAKVRFEVNVRNLFNQAAVISRVTQMNRSSAINAGVLPPDATGFFKGYDPTSFITPNGGSGKVPVNPIYGLPGGSYRAGGGPDTTNDRYSSAFAVSFPNFGAYQDFRTIRLGLRFIF